MSRYPGAKWRPLKENATQPEIKPTQLIFHSAVSKGLSLFDFFEQDKVVVESHMYVQDDGDTEQYIDTNTQADANYKANPRAISVETWDNGDPDTVPWTPKQLRRLADIAAWAHIEHDIPIVRAPSATSPGMGGHTDYPSWSNVKGKTCPGRARVGQIPLILKMAQAIVDGRLKSPLTQGDDLVLDAATTKQLRTLLQAELRTVLGNANSEVDADRTHDSLADVERSLREVLGRLDAIESALRAGASATASSLPDEPVTPEEQPTG